MSYKLALVSILLFLTTSVMSQTIKVSDNKKSEFLNNYYLKVNTQDTTYLILDFEQKLLKIEKYKETAGEYKFDGFRFTLSFESLNEKVYFTHIARPPYGNEIYLVDKSSISQDKIILEFDKNATFWYQNDIRLRDTIVILIDLKDWENKKDCVKGIGVQVSTNTIE